MRVRLQTAAACTLAAIAAYDTIQNSAAAAAQPIATETDATPPVMVPTLRESPVQRPQVAPPETVIAQEFSSAKPHQSDRVVAVVPDPVTAVEAQAPSAASPVRTAPAIATEPPPPPPVVTAQSAPLPPPTAAPASISDPVWVVPTQPTPPPAITTPPPPAAPATPATVTVPPLDAIPQPAPNPAVAAPSAPSSVVPATPLQPTATNELAVTVTAVQIVGATAELQELAQRSIQTRPGRQVTTAQLQQDVAALLETGFFTTANVVTQPNPQGIGVFFQVEPTVVQAVQLSGAQVLPQSVVNEIFRYQVGRPISPSTLTQGVRQVNQWYARNGYSLARVLTLEPRRDGVLTLAVAEGPVSAIKIRFLNDKGKAVDDKGQPIRPRTQIGFVQDNIKLQPGQVFREEVARQDIQRLNQLGIFQSSSVAFEGDARQVTVVYNLIEAPPRSFNFGGGYNDYIGLYGTVNFQDNNFAGLAQQIGANVQVGTRDVLFDAQFRSPYRDIYPNTPGYNANVFRGGGLSQVFDSNIKLANGSTVRERRLGGGVGLEKPLGPEWDGSLRLNYSNISMRDRDGEVFATDALGNPLTLSGTGIDDLTTVALAATRDRRDNAISPRDGSLLKLQAEQSIPVGRGDILGTKLQANYAQYVPVNLLRTASDNAKPSESQPEVLAFNVQGGTTVGDLPPYNAFLLGGLDSVRGYGTGDVATSRSFLQLSAEYRFPIYRFIGGVVFADYASDLGSSDNVLGEPGIQRGKPGDGFGYGLGVRVNSPFGVIRADFGLNDQGDSRLQFGFGQRF